MLKKNDFSNALYALNKARAYAATVILTLGIALGALIAMFSLNYQILAAPLPYADEELLVVGSTEWLNKDGSVANPRVLPKVIQRTYPKPSDKISDHALYDSFDFATLRDLPHSPTIQPAYTTPGYMRMYQMPILHGRAFSDAEDVGSHQPVAIMTEQLWRRHYHADPAIIGRKIQVGTTDFTVVGIAGADFIPPAFAGPASPPVDVWLQWDFYTAFHTLLDSNLTSGFYLAKLKTKDARQAFEQELRPQLNSLWQDANTNPAGRSLRFNAEPLRPLLEGDSSTQTLWMLAGSLVLLLIAAANITNLLLSRAAHQQRQLSIQAALGAQRHHLLYQILAEMSWLMLMAMLLGLLVCKAAYVLLKIYAGETIPRLAELGIDWPVLLFALLFTLLLAMSFLWLISRQLNYQALQQNLQSSGKGCGIQISYNTRQMLIGSQVMLAAMLLVCCTQVLQQSLTQLRQNVGFATTDRYQVLIENIAPAPEHNVSAEQRTAVYRQQKEEMMQVRDILRQHPAVQQVSVGSGSPASFNGYSGNWGAFLPSADNHEAMIEASVTHTDQYFLPLFDILLLQGRNFTAQEVTTQAKVIVVNQEFANKLQPDGNVIGQRLYTPRGGPVYEIIGISKNHNVPAAGQTGDVERAYTTQNMIYGLYLLLELKPGMQIDALTLNKAFTQVAPHYRSAGIFSVAENVNLALIRHHLASAITSTLVLICFVLAAIGIYGVLSYNVQLRRFELGVRMSIGARPFTILRQLLGENLKPVLLGLLLAMLALTVLWFGLKHAALSVELSGSGFALPLLLIVLLTVLTTLLSVWSIIRKPAIYALQGR